MRTLVFVTCLVVALSVKASAAAIGPNEVKGWEGVGSFEKPYRAASPQEPRPAFVFTTQSIDWAIRSVLPLAAATTIERQGENLGLSEEKIRAGYNRNAFIVVALTWKN